MLKHGKCLATNSQGVCDAMNEVFQECPSLTFVYADNFEFIFCYYMKNQNLSMVGDIFSVFM
jgi:hypothetical protein